MRSYLDVVVPHLSQEIAGRGALDRVRAVAGLLPTCHVGGIELRLADDQPALDFVARLADDRGAVPTPFVAHPAWQLVERARRLVSAPSPGDDLVSHVLLEFDLDEPPSPVPVPGLFLELNWAKAAAPGALSSLVDAMGPGFTESAPNRDLLERCVTALPSGASPSHLGAMLSRPQHALRVAVQALPPATVPEYLANIGWRDHDGAFAEFIAGVTPLVDPWTMVGMDVRDRVHARVGVEFFLQRGRDGRGRWRALLDHLVGRGLASDAKVRGVLEWPGAMRAPEAGGSWPSHLEPADRVLRGIGESVIWRRISHIKLVYRPDGVAEAKVYLAFGHSWLPAGAPDAR